MQSKGSDRFFFAFGIAWVRRFLELRGRPYCLVASIVLITGCMACAGARAPEQAAFSAPRWPPPPAVTRFVYVTTLRSGLDIAPPEDSLLRSLAGRKEPKAGFGKPYGIATKAGMIFITDTRERLVHAFDLPNRRYFKFGYRFEGTLQKPLGISVDDQQRVYVVDATSRRVVVYDRLGLFQRFLGSEEELEHPTDVAVSADGTRIYVIDTGGVDSESHRVVAYGPQGQKLFQIGERGTGDGHFNLPVSASVAPDGTLFVLDAGNFRVQAFDSSGHHLRSWGSVGDSWGQFARPKALTTDRAGRVYVADAAMGNIQVFDDQGKLLLPIGRLGREDKPGRYALPIGLATDERGHLYVLDQIFKKIDVIKHIEPNPSSH